MCERERQTTIDYYFIATNRFVISSLVSHAFVLSLIMGDFFFCISICEIVAFRSISIVSKHDTLKWRKNRRCVVLYIHTRAEWIVLVVGWPCTSLNFKNKQSRKMLIHNENNIRLFFICVLRPMQRARRAAGESEQVSERERNGLHKSIVFQSILGRLRNTINNKAPACHGDVARRQHASTSMLLFGMKKNFLMGPVGLFIACMHVLHVNVWEFPDHAQSMSNCVRCMHLHRTVFWLCVNTRVETVTNAFNFQ